MSLARDEVARDVLIALVTNGDSDPVGLAVSLTDALLAALSPAPVPAATVPTPYAPKVGDKIRTTEEPTTDKWDGTLIVLKDGFVTFAGVPHIDAIRTDDSGKDPHASGFYVAAKCVYLGPATAAERAAAGLPVDEAKPTPAYPVDAEGRPLWVRVTALNGHRPAAPLLTVGRIYKVTGWSSVGCPSVTTDYGQDGWWLSRKGNAPDPECPKYPAWEPCAAPAETPAIAPTPALEPRRTVGAVVRGGAAYREFIVVKSGVNPDEPEQRLLDEPIVKACAIEEDTFVRWATKEECDRHGVPFVDRTTPAAALTEAERNEAADLARLAYYGSGTYMTPWKALDGYERSRWINAADAAAAWFAKRGAK